MIYRKIGHTNIEASAITFGAWAIGGWMWGGADRKEAVEAIKSSYDLGVTSIDTAPIYGQGLSEEIIAEALKGIPRDKVQIFTKFGLRWDLAQGEFYFNTLDNFNHPLAVYKYASKESVIKECEDCLKRLQTDYIDLFQIHWNDSTTPKSETMEALIRLEEQGKIRAGGVCNYTADWVEEANNTYTLASVQNPYSMVMKDIEKEIVPYAIKHNKAVLAYSPLQRGLLTGKIKSDYQFKEEDTRKGNRFYTPENIALVNNFLATIKPIGDSKGATIGQLVIQWTIQQPGITIALVGARNAMQATENAKAIDVAITPDEMQFINSKIAALKPIFP